ncbi:MAG: hypothetical protein ACREIP_15270, partial [Alphaproteobacteria bacterium]
VAQRVRQAMVFDADKDGRVTLAELDKAAEAAFREVDADRNGTISQDEYMRFYQQLRAVPRYEDTAACQVPKPSEASKLIVVSAYETEAISTTTLGTQDAEIGTGSIIIEPGAEPIYLVVATYRPTIWRIMGAVGRLERVVLTSALTGPNRGALNEPPLAGVTGVDKDRVSFFQNPRCVGYFTERPSPQSKAAFAVLQRLTGKEPAGVTTRYALSQVAVPSGIGAGTRKSMVVVYSGGSRIHIENGQPKVVTEKGAALAERMLNELTPGGIVEIDPAAVVASKPAERYEVLPREAGLLQLVRSGALTVSDNGEFVIRRKIRLPAGLYGAHSVKFILARGVPEPEGNVGHAQIISEETGLPITGTRR